MQTKNKLIPHGYVKRVAEKLGMTPQSISNINKGKTHNPLTIEKAKWAYKQLLKEDLMREIEKQLNE